MLAFIAIEPHLAMREDIWKGNIMAQEPEIVPEQENRIREHVAETAWCILEDRPLIGSGNDYKPTESDARLVAVLAGITTPEKKIAKQLGISLETLKKYYQNSLDDGKPYVENLLERTLMACVVQAPNNPKHFPALKLALANKCGYTDKQQVDNLNSDGQGMLVLLPQRPPKKAQRER